MSIDLKKAQAAKPTIAQRGEATTIGLAETRTQIKAVWKLWHAYVAEAEFHPMLRHIVDKELAAENLELKYTPPRGAILIASHQGHPIGCVAARQLTGEACEMKRLFVCPHMRESGIGEALVRELIVVCRDLGYSVMRIATLEKFAQAIRLYEKLGFRRIDSYYFEPDPVPGCIFLELDISGEENNDAKPQERAAGNP